MLCECGKREATVHEVVIKNGKKVEKHLCEVCAQQQGIPTQPSMPISELLSSFVIASGTAQPTLQCPSCSLQFDEFKRTGQLGCPDCYDAFEEPLALLLERTHEGATHHVGKIPRRAGQERGDLAGERTLQRAEMVRTLRKRLESALRDEDYENAAAIRDELTRLFGPERSPGDEP